MSRILPVVLSFVALQCVASAQWERQHSGTDASLRGVHAVNASIAWASGTDGTVLRTTDGGEHWQKCAVPPDSDKLDFRGVWAWDAQVAVVMSSGPGEQSRVYRTNDGCTHWSEERRNPYKDGFWDAIAYRTPEDAELIGDPVNGRFYHEVLRTGRGWKVDPRFCKATPEEGAFAASNSSLVVFENGELLLGTGGKSGAHVLLASGDECQTISVPLAGGNESSGVFSLAFRDRQHGMAVGGDYKKPAQSYGAAAWTEDGGLHWAAAVKPPHGYRSAVAWYEKAKVWIAVGSNGTDISADNGKTWIPIDDGNWNALSLPYVVGPDGRIGRANSLPQH
jgi:photosystem II stability/assembly factor-like uncharacterized protein